jgi:hypothetical protein
MISFQELVGVIDGMVRTCICDTIVITGRTVTHGVAFSTLWPSENAAALAVRRSSVPSRPERISTSVADRMPV